MLSGALHQTSVYAWWSRGFTAFAGWRRGVRRARERESEESWAMTFERKAVPSSAIDFHGKLEKFSPPPATHYTVSLSFSMRYGFFDLDPLAVLRWAPSRMIISIAPVFFFHFLVVSVSLLVSCHPVSRPLVLIELSFRHSYWGSVLFCKF